VGLTKTVGLNLVGVGLKITVSLKKAVGLELAGIDMNKATGMNIATCLNKAVGLPTAVCFKMAVGLMKTERRHEFVEEV
jgi:hypothetical protein